MQSRAILALPLLTLLATPASGASLADRIVSAHADQVVFRFETFDDVWGDDNGSINRGDPDGGYSVHFGAWTSDSGRHGHGEWHSGPMNILLRRDRENHKARKLKMYVGDSWRGHASSDAVDLGLVTAEEAADWLLDQVESNHDEEIAKDAVCAATFVKGADIWPRLINAAKDRSRPEEVRKSCLFWIGQEAGARATATLTDIVNDNDEDSDVRESAVFALTQRPDEESIPILMRLAKTSPHPEVRRSAFFWLGQKDDPEVIKFLEDVITGG